MDHRAEERRYFHWLCTKMDPETEAVKICNAVHIDEREKSCNLDKIEISESKLTEKNEAQQIETVHLSMMNNTHDAPEEPEVLQNLVSDNQSYKQRSTTKKTLLSNKGRFYI